jgi:hypothetical protein
LRFLPSLQAVSGQEIRAADATKWQTGNRNSHPE